MIVTHTQNVDGARRIYLGGKGSLEAWIEPADAQGRWRFQCIAAATGQPVDADTMRTWAIHTLLELARELDVPPGDLATVPFDEIAALHQADPMSDRRSPIGRRRAVESGFLSTAPHIRQPRAAFTPGEPPRQRQR